MKKVFLQVDEETISRLYDVVWLPRAGSTGRYYSLREHRFVSANIVMSDLNKATESIWMDVLSLATSYGNGGISIQGFYDSVKNLLRKGHRLSAVVARGGLRSMETVDWRRLGGLTWNEYYYLGRMCSQLASGLLDKKSGTFINRLKQYVKSFYATFQQFLRMGAIRNGYTEEARRVNRVAEHCVDCVAWSFEIIGWQPIGSLPNIGDAKCMNNCRCHFIYRKTSGVSVDQEFVIGGMFSNAEKREDIFDDPHICEHCGGRIEEDTAFEISENGHLILIRNGNASDLGQVAKRGAPGPRGYQGPPGPGIVAAANRNGNLLLKMTSGDVVNVGTLFGRTIVDVSVNSDVVALEWSDGDIQEIKVK